jgi:hypothetical protein
MADAVPPPTTNGAARPPYRSPVPLGEYVFEPGMPPTFVPARETGEDEAPTAPLAAPT